MHDKQKTALVTGGFGFLGRAVALGFHAAGYRVVGLGHGEWTAEESAEFGFDNWFESDVSLVSLRALGEQFDAVAHCAGTSSVGYSLMNPLEAFQKTVQSTAELLEYLRRNESTATLIYPSSAAVYGAVEDRPLLEDATPNPVSPYGDHKIIAERLLESYSRNFGIRVAVIRFFSIYGPCLSKQLLWDASTKLMAGSHEAVFWGTGDETRDWIHVTDAATLMVKAIECMAPFTVINGAAGQRVTVGEVLQMLKQALGVDVQIRFNGYTRAGDPRFYWADVSMLRQLGIELTVPLQQGLIEYAHWFRNK